MDSIKIPTPCQDYKVMVRCHTYNQKGYIFDALNGFAMQQTNFPYCVLVIDDASTDNEPEVIIDYVNKTCDMRNVDEYNNELIHAYVVKHKVNIDCTFVILLLKENHYQHGKNMKLYCQPWRERCKYEALCEGDDYWIDPLKLQKEVEIMESNDRITMVYTDYHTVDSNGAHIFRPEYENKYKKYSTSGDILPILFKTNFPLTCTTLFRKSIFDTELFANLPSSLDYGYFMVAAFLGECHYIPEPMACYRNNPGSMMNTALTRINTAYEKLNRYFAIEYAKGKSKNESIGIDYSIKMTIIERFCTDYEMIKILRNIDLSFYVLYYYVLIRNYLNYRLLQ